MLSLIAAVILVMLIIGLVAVNGFSRPIQRLSELTREIAEGRLPRVQKSTGGTEIDKLFNQFVELTESLRRKEAEVEAAHQQLRRSAITERAWASSSGASRRIRRRRRSAWPRCRGAGRPGRPTYSPGLARKRARH